jgi:hypothetical protein
VKTLNAVAQLIAAPGFSSTRALLDREAKPEEGRDRAFRSRALHERKILASKLLNDQSTAQKVP